MESARTHADYLAALEPEPRTALEALRTLILAAVPEAEEGWSYGVPAFRLQGKPIAGFAACTGHLSYYPMSGRVVAAFAAALEGFSTSSGTIRFTPEAPLPPELVRKLLKARIAELRIVRKGRSRRR
ncbi:MAG: DUF1801 domain-containing protein [Pseudomonadota bacterium]